METQELEQLKKMMKEVVVEELGNLGIVKTLEKEMKEIKEKLSKGNLRKFIVKVMREEGMSWG